MKAGYSYLNTGKDPLYTEELGDSDCERSGVYTNLNTENNFIVNIPPWILTPIRSHSTSDSSRSPREGNSGIYISDIYELDVTDSSDINVVNAEGGNGRSYLFIVYVHILCLIIFLFYALAMPYVIFGIILNE